MSMFTGQSADFYVGGVPVTMTSEPTTRSADNLSFQITSLAHRHMDPNTAATVETGKIEKDTLTITGGPPSGGTFSLAVDGNNCTGTLNYNATPAQVQAHLLTATGYAAGDITCSGTDLPAGTVNIVFGDDKAPGSHVITIQANGLTPSGTPVITRTVQGTAWAADTSYTSLTYLIGTVSWPTSRADYLCRLSGKYVPLSQCANGVGWEFTAETNLINATVFRKVWREQKAGFGSATAKLARLYANEYFVDAIITGTEVIGVFYIDVDANVGIIAQLLIQNEGIKTAPEALVTEDLTFEVLGKPSLFTA